MVFIMTRLRAGQAGLRVAAGAKNFSVPQNVLTGDEALPASCWYRVSFPGEYVPGGEVNHSI